MSVEILADTVGNAPRFASYGSVGFSEISFGDQPVEPSQEVVRVRPTCSTPPGPTRSTTR